MTNYPKALYRAGSEFEWEGKSFDRIQVEDEESHEAALADGWLHPRDALDATDATLLDQSAAKITEALPSQSDEQLIEFLDAERAGKSRKGVLAAIEDEIGKR